jgi:hypothetical protein
VAITTLSQLRTGIKPDEIRLLQKSTVPAEATGFLVSLFRAPGLPEPGATPVSGLAGAALSAPILGQIPVDTTSILTNYMVGAKYTSATSNSMLIVDRLWENSGIVVTTLTAQTINSVVFPARETTGDNVMVGIEVSTATTNVSAVTTITMSYTNSNNVAGRTATISSFPATAVAHSLTLFELQAGDQGVQSIQSITLGTSLVTGGIHLVAFKPIFSMVSNSPKTNSVNFMSCNMPALPAANCVPFGIIIPGTVTTGMVMADFAFAQG